MWFHNKMLSSQWDNDNQHFVYIIFNWYFLGIITRQGFFYPCSCRNRCTCLSWKAIMRFSSLAETAMCIWVSKLNFIVSCHGLSPGCSQAIFWTNAGIFFMQPIETNTFAFKNMHFEKSTKWRPFCFGLNVWICILLSWERPWALHDDWHTKIQVTMTRLYDNHGSYKLFWD